MLRSTFAGLNTMYRGVSTNRTSLETTGHNMTNSSVEGYSRQLVNQAATSPDGTYSSYGQVYIGSGTDALSITRARDVFADKQYWRDNAAMEYDYERQKNYQKLEVIFNDSNDTGLRNVIQGFADSLKAIPGNGHDETLRTELIRKANMMAEWMNNAVTGPGGLQKQIESEYDGIQISINRVNTIIDGIVQSNKAIAKAEAAGGFANDLRDERDSLVDELSGYMSISVTENKSNGMYTVVCNGASIVNGITKIPLTLGPRYEDGRQPGIPNKHYGITDYNIELGNTGVMLNPLSGKLAGAVDAIAEDKAYIDELVSMASFLLTDFNAQHKMGIGAGANNVMSVLKDTGDGAVPTTEIVNRLKDYTGLNFFGEDGKAYFWDAENNCLNVVTQKVEITCKEEPVAGDSDHHIYTFAIDTDQVDHANDLEGIEILSALRVNTAIQNDCRKFAARRLNEASYSVDDLTGVTPKIDNASSIWSAYMPVPAITSGSQHTEFTIDTMRKKSGDENDRDQFEDIADGSNAQRLNNLLSMNKNEEMAAIYTTPSALGDSGLQQHYRTTMMGLSVDSEAMNVTVLSQEDLVEQIVQWRTSVAGVNWDEELTNMIMFQQGYSACSRCLTTMDEMLDRLINSTGVVGR